ncbi:unnamed protein product [Heterosigma akashiwo]|eukprot:CAMPEP_0194572870 /NCGR_PEP_ID=MMETSP0292-20121207/9275_1 /TAXON_ID=39354 /ORGANISM="Heterosigma akashiwo, Strain CCMP2393" /LENGTH=419 /DNA_ID=CAMNT_0039423931 /DNA_START=97 /DNA_END=1356 /DNA_ORIENTATION=+
MSQTTGLEFSFACGGWLQFYLYGVAKCFIDHDLHEDCKAVGCSAGALAATAMTIGGSFETVMDFCKSTLIPECRNNLAGPFKINSYVDRCLDAATDLSKYEQANGRLFVQTTSLPRFQSVRVSRFESALDMKTTLLASCAAFPLSPLVRRLDGGLYVDGGLSDFQPILSKRTITVNPLWFWKADIKPSRYVPAIWAALPPKDPSTIDWLFDLGYKDCLSWMAKNGYAHTCTHCEDGDIVTCSKRPERAPHPYDQNSKSSFQRVFGYGSQSSPLMRLLDSLWVFWLTVLWKPIALALVAIELLALGLLAAAKGVWKEALPILPLALFGACLVRPATGQYALLLGAALALKLLACGSSAGGGPRGGGGEGEWGRAAACLAGAADPTLYLRGVPGLGRRVRVLSHAALERHSLVYRVVVHIL